MMNNPLAAQRPQQDDPMRRHAMVWAQMQQQSPDALHQHIMLTDYALPVLGALAANPNVNAKDVVKAVSGAVADRRIDPAQGVAFISKIPADDDKVGPWLKQTYADAITSNVHAKAALITKARQAQMAQGPQPMAPNPMARPPMAPNPMVQQ